MLLSYQETIAACYELHVNYIINIISQGGRAILVYVLLECLANSSIQLAVHIVTSLL